MLRGINCAFIMEKWQKSPTLALAITQLAVTPIAVSRRINARLDPGRFIFRGDPIGRPLQLLHVVRGAGRSEGMYACHADRRYQQARFSKADAA
jgi:hypothetical protein